MNNPSLVGDTNFIQRLLANAERPAPTAAGSPAEQLEREVATALESDAQAQPIVPPQALVITNEAEFQLAHWISERDRLGKTLAELDKGIEYYSEIARVCRTRLRTLRHERNGVAAVLKGALAFITGLNKAGYREGSDGK